jgi:hypothetical protein
MGLQVSKLNANFTKLESQRLTVAAWMKRAGFPGPGQYIVAKGDENCMASSYGISTGPNDSPGLRFFVWTRGYGFLNTAVAPNSVWDGAWHLVAGTFDGIYLRFYVDGTEIGDPTGAAGPISYHVPYAVLGIGDSSFAEQCPGVFAGSLDDVQIFDRALTTPEIAALAAPPATTPNPGTPASSGSSPASPGGPSSSGTPPASGGSTSGNADHSGAPTAQPQTLRVVALLDYALHKSGAVDLRGLTIDGLRTGDRVRVACQGRGCRSELRTIDVKSIMRGRAALRRAVRGITLRPGAVLTVTVSRKQYVNVITRYVIRRQQSPRRTARCRAPGSTATRKCG